MVQSPRETDPEPDVKGAWLTDYWRDYRDQAISNNDEARGLARPALRLLARLARQASPAGG